jgi:hypothetical protein
MNQKISDWLACDEDGDSPLTWRLFVLAAICILAAAVLFSPTRRQLDEGINDRINQRIHWIETDPLLRNCGIGPRDLGCQFGFFSLESRGWVMDPVFVLFKDRRAVASIVRSKLFVDSGLNEAERTSIRNEFSISGSDPSSSTKG